MFTRQECVFKAITIILMHHISHLRAWNICGQILFWRTNVFLSALKMEVISQLTDVWFFSKLSLFTTAFLYIFSNVFSSSFNTFEPCKSTDCLLYFRMDISMKLIFCLSGSRKLFTPLFLLKIPDFAIHVYNFYDIFAIFAAIKSLVIECNTVFLT